MSDAIQLPAMRSRDAARAFLGLSLPFAAGILTWWAVVLGHEFQPATETIRYFLRMCHLPGLAVAVAAGGTFCLNIPFYWQQTRSCGTRWLNSLLLFWLPLGCFGIAVLQWNTLDAPDRAPGTVALIFAAAGYWGIYLPVVSSYLSNAPWGWRESFFCSVGHTALAVALWLGGTIMSYGQCTWRTLLEFTPPPPPAPCFTLLGEWLNRTPAGWTYAAGLMIGGILCWYFCMLRLLAHLSQTPPRRIIGRGGAALWGTLGGVFLTLTLWNIGTAIRADRAETRLRQRFDLSRETRWPHSDPPDWTELYTRLEKVATVRSELGLPYFIDETTVLNEAQWDPLPAIFQLPETLELEAELNRAPRFREAPSEYFRQLLQLQILRLLHARRRSDIAAEVRARTHMRQILRLQSVTISGMSSLLNYLAAGDDYIRLSGDPARKTTSENIAEQTFLRQTQQDLNRQEQAALRGEAERAMALFRYLRDPRPAMPQQPLLPPEELRFFFPEIQQLANRYRHWMAKEANLPDLAHASPTYPDPPFVDVLRLGNTRSPSQRLQDLRRQLQNRLQE